MLSFRFLNKPDAAVIEQIVSLYSRQGWWVKGDSHALAAALIRKSHCFLAVFDKGRAIGMGRAISDRVSDAYIQDVMVLDEYRGRDIGSRIIRALKRRLKADGIKWLGLIAQDNSEGFYRKLGFTPIKRARPMMLKGNRV
jgi:spermidine synthase